jgi:very-short-patch-repair endonuclease
MSHSGPYVVDFLWRSERFVLEADGYHAHRGATAFESDRRRDTALATLGYEVRRVTWDQVANSPASVAAMLRARLEIGA